MSAKPKAETPPPLNIVFKALVAQGSELGEADDKISLLIQRIEDGLRGSLTSRISVEMFMDENDGEIAFLTFGKHDGRFMLVFEWGDYVPNGDVNVKHATPLLNCSRETRAKVFSDGHVEKLIRSARDQVATQIAERKKALAVAQQIADAVEAFAVKESTPEASPDDDIPF